MVTAKATRGGRPAAPDSRPRPTVPALPVSPTVTSRASQVLPRTLAAVQRSAGNRAATTLVVSRQSVAGMSTRSGTSAVAPSPPPMSMAAEPMLESPHPEVNRRPVTAVDSDLRARLGRFQRAITSMRRNSESTKQDEIDWYAGRGLMGGFIDIFNSAKRTDPTRWEAVLHRWDEAADALRAALDVPVSTDRINDLGLRAQQGLTIFQDAVDQDRQRREEYSQYLSGFTHAAEGVHGGAVMVRDVAFATAVGLAVVAAAPVVAGGVAAFGTGTLGLASGSTGLAVFTYGGTAAVMGAGGALFEGAGQGLATLGAQASMALADFLRGRTDAVDNFDFHAVGAGTVEGLKRGFVDGVLAFAGGEAEKFIASNVASSAAIRSMFGAGNSSLYAMMIRRALTRAVAGGASGSVVGALSAAYRAAAEGQDLHGIMAAVAAGFALGGGGGAVLGGAGGAWEGRSAYQLQTRIAAALRARAAASPASMADDAFVTSLMDQLRANPSAGTNQQVLDLTPRVWRALHDPDRVANALAEIWLEEHLLGVMAPRAASARYGEAASVLARRRGAPLVILPSGAPRLNADQFFEHVVVPGYRFLDYSALDLTATGEHGAITHFVQDLAVDSVLAEAGITSPQYRALLGGTVAAEGRSTIPGALLWEALYDAQTGRMNQPEVIYAVIRSILADMP